MFDECDIADPKKEIISEKAQKACPLSPISELCSAFKDISISDRCESRDKDDLFESLSEVVCAMEVKIKDNQSYLSNKGPPRAEVESGGQAMLNPFLYVEKSCQVFATRIVNGIKAAIQCSLDEIQCKAVATTITEILKPEVRCLQNLINSYKDDPKFASVNFQQVHSRIGMIVASKLLESLSEDDLKLVISSLERVLLPDPETVFSSDEEDNVDQYRKHRTSNTANVNHINCLVFSLYSALTSDGDSCNDDMLSEKVKIGPKNLTEDEYDTLWSNIQECNCRWESQNFVRNSRKTSSLKRIFRLYHNGSNKLSKKEAARTTALDSVTRKLFFDDDDESDGKIRIWHPGDSDSDHTVAKYKNSANVYSSSASSDDTIDGYSHFQLQNEDKNCKELNFRQAKRTTQSFRKDVGKSHDVKQTEEFSEKEMKSTKQDTIDSGKKWL